jgi:hypothetical protein
MRRPVAAAGILIVALATNPGAVLAQAPAAAPKEHADIDKLPVSLTRIRRELRRDVKSEERFENFRLLTSLQVYGEAPGIEFFTTLEDESFKSPPGAVRYGGVTHSEFLAQVQPKNLPYGNSRPPIANLSGNTISLWGAAKDKNKEAEKKRKKEEEARKKRNLEATTNDK